MHKNLRALDVMCSQRKYHEISTEIPAGQFKIDFSQMVNRMIPPNVGLIVRACAQKHAYQKKEKPLATTRFVPMIHGTEGDRIICERADSPMNLQHDLLYLLSQGVSSRKLRLKPLLKQRVWVCPEAVR